MPRYMHLSIYDEDRMEKIMAAMAAKARRDILRLVNENSYSVTEIARLLNMPTSTAAFHINHLQAADLIHVQTKSAQHGSSKIISRKLDELNISYVPDYDSHSVMTTVMDIPIGSFTDCQAAPSCGMATESNIIENDDVPAVFFSPARLGAQIIWFSAGYLEYRLPNYVLRDKEPVGLSFSLEICSEAPNYRMNWESDITFWVNGREICTWTSPGDFGGHRGQLNPEWWADSATQYGLLKTIRINSRGVYLDENKVSALTLTELAIDEGEYFTLRIGIKPDAVNVGGLNLFGEKFGNYQQNIIVKLSYQDK
ncbi:MAG: ArsR family transcriptional regulator [Ruminococcaceae bacterium]|nr:ArsR family transcriptional regulator [Oscillospiraceae bacterium]